jgi:hypothetical protein
LEDHMQQAPRFPTFSSLRARLLAWFGRSPSTDLQRDPEAADIDRVRRDVDASLCDMRLITRPNAGPSELLPERLRLLGLDPAYVEAVQEATLVKLQESCSDCDSWRRCARDLARGDVAVGMERYCQNAALLDELVVGRQKS